MKYKVIRRFRDKYTGERFLPGDLFEGETGRIKELMGRNFIETASFTKKELLSMLEERGIEANEKMKKDDLLSLLGGE